MAVVEVEVLESCMVMPEEVTPKHRLWLSVLDFLVFRTHTPMVFFYRPGHGPAAAFSPDMLKAALSKALVPFYPLAGRLAPGSVGRPEILCTGDGVLFVTARTDTTLNEMGKSAPSDDLRGALVPSAMIGDHAGILAMFQVTFFRCGGVCLGTAIHHMASDGRGFSNFLRTWSAIARGADEAAMPPRPFLDRTLLRARPAAPGVRFSDRAEYPRRGHVASTPEAPYASAVLTVSNDQINALKAAAGAGKKVSTFSAVAAHVWRCACTARGVAGTEDTTRVYTSVDVRSRVSPPLPAGYLGNALIRASAAAKVKDIVSGALDAVADKVSAATRVSDEYVRSTVDYLEHATSDGEGLHPGQWVTPETELWIVSWRGLRFSEVDFGWGPPAFFVRGTFKFSNLVYLVPSPDGNGLNVAVSMEPARLARFEKLFYQGLKHYSLVSQAHVAPNVCGVKHSKL